MANSSNAISQSTEVDMGSPSQLNFGVTPTLNTTSKVVTCYFRRDAASNNNVQIRYVAVQHKS
jgi:hypothetical protein